MAGFKEMRFPLEVSAWIVGGPEWNTRIFSLLNENESRLQIWQYPLHKFDGGNGLRELANAQATKTFHLRARGRGYGFRLLDPLDANVDIASGNLVATAAAGVYQLVKDYVQDGDTFRRVITKPIPGQCTVLKNGVAVTDPIDYTTGLATIPGVIAGDVLSWTGMFDVPVRFDSDWLELGVDHGGLMNWNSIKLLELRTVGTSIGTPPGL